MRSIGLRNVTWLAGRVGRRAETDCRARHGRPRWSTKLAVRRMGACAETRHYSEGNDHRIGRVCVVRAFSPGSPGLAEASARQETSRIRDSGKAHRAATRIGIALRISVLWSTHGPLKPRQLERPMGHTSVQAFRRDPQPNRPALARYRLSHGDARWTASRRTRDLRTPRLRLWDSRKSPESAAVVEGTMGTRG